MQCDTVIICFNYSALLITVLLFSYRRVVDANALLLCPHILVLHRQFKCYRGLSGRFEVSGLAFSNGECHLRISIICELERLGLPSTCWRPCTAEKGTKIDKGRLHSMLLYLDS